MAKFVQVGYGHDGRGMGKSGNGYTYVVDDSIKKGDTIFPSVRHYKSGVIFGTTGVVDRTTKNLNRNIANNEEIRGELEEKGIVEVDDNGKVVDQEFLKSGLGGITPVFKGKQVGAQRERDESGKFASNIEEYGGLTQYQEETRQFNVEARKQIEQRKNQTFDEYAKQFMGDNE